MFRALYSQHLEVKVVSHSTWYHHKRRWWSGAQVETGLCTGRISTRVTIPDAV